VYFIEPLIRSSVFFNPGKSAALDKIPHHNLSFFIKGKSICIEGNYQSWLFFFVLLLASLAQQ
jgi:hypothetical protein